MAVLLVLCPALRSSGATIVPSYLNVAPSERLVIDFAIARWEDLLPGAHVFSISVQRTPMGGSTLGRSSNFVEAFGVPAAATITLDDGSSGIEWYVDPVPADDLEFREGHNPYHAVARNGVASHGYDLLTVVQHELAHALGFSVFYSAFGARVTGTPDGNRAYAGATASARLTGAGAGTHLLPQHHPFDLMNPALSRGTRLNPGPLDLALLHDAFGYDVAPAIPLQPVPETGAALLVIAGMLAWRRARGEGKTRRLLRWTRPRFAPRL